MTSVAPFTPAASCFAPTYTVAPLGNDVVGDLTAIRGYASECLPFTPEPTGYPTMHAVNCLPGYERLSGSSTEGASTYGTCCPSGMTVGITSKQFCSKVTGYNSVAVINATQTSSVHANFLMAPALVMAWQSPDLASLTAPITQSGPSFDPEPTGLYTTTVVASIPTSSSTGVTFASSQDNTADAIHHTVILAVVIAIACLVAIGVCFAVGAFIMARKRQQKKARGQMKEDLPPAYQARRSQSSEELPRYVPGTKTESEVVK